ncbi:MAG: histone deacetylase [Saprospiraceae bacterium]|jgi:acetoin utilization deacetylase AcuC-like enzyme|nr:histone deacetylase [Saprospiraceae bacterium]
MLKVAWSPTYRYDLPEGHRFPMEKYDVLPEQLLYEGTIQNENIFQPEALSDEDILLTHTADYLYKLNSQTLSRKEIRDIGFPMTEALVMRGKHIANGTYQCARYAKQVGISMNSAGGTHHSFAHRGEGFCVFNDLAIASSLLLSRGEAQRILIVDLDVHQGNGTASIFRGNSKMFTFSMHGQRNYPTRKEQSSLDIGLPDGTGDSEYLNILQNQLPRVIDAFQPDFLFYQAGVDVLESDKLGRLSLSRQGCRKRDNIVLSLAKAYHLPIAVTMGGGYSTRLADIIEAHANTFRLAQEIYF